MTACPPCGLDGPCTDGQCAVRTHRCPSCSTPYPSAAAADACAQIDADADRHRSRFTD